MRNGHLLLSDGDAYNLALIQERGSKPLFQRYAMAPALAHIANEVRREIGFILSQGNKEFLSSVEIYEILNQAAEKSGFELSSFERDEILSQIESEQKPFGILQKLAEDPAVTDIIVTNYAKIVIQQGRLNFNTDLSFANQETYENFVERLLQKAGTTCSTKKPIADGMIGKFARIHVVHQSICESGPYLTIRLNRFSSINLEQLIDTGLASKMVINYLNTVVTTGHTVLVAGEVGTGKTTLARALAAGIPINESILVIEDTPEIVLEHPQVRYVRTREANSEASGRITPSECIRAGMRMAMNRIIFGEIRDAEAAEAFIDVCASGHPGLSTIHAKSASRAITRLELFLGRAQKGVDASILSQQVSAAVQVVVFVDMCHKTGKRRIMQVRELGSVADGTMRFRDIFRYRCVDNNPEWEVVTKLSSLIDYRF